jgi:hypothetical protein
MQVYQAVGCTASVSLLLLLVLVLLNNAVATTVTLAAAACRHHRSDFIMYFNILTGKESLEGGA